MNRTKIEEMLKELDRRKRSHFWRRNLYAQEDALWDIHDKMAFEIGVIMESLTSLLAEDGGEDEPYMGWCDVDGCTNEASANGMYYKDTGYWRLCPKHSQLARDGNPQPKMKQSSIDRENSRDKVTRELPSQHTKGEGV